MATTLYECPPTPNNIKARIALNYLEVPYERVEVPVKFPLEPGDRDIVVEATGQPFTPALVHDGTVVYDSRFILRFLDVNIGKPKGKRLFSADGQTMRAIEEWEHFGREILNAPLGAAVGQAFAGECDTEALARSSAELNELTGRIETALGDWLVGDQMTAADITCAPIVRYGMLTAEEAAGGPISTFLHTHLHLGDGRDRTRAWVDRVMAYRD